MKKRLALLLSVAMAFSMFANVAFGADAAKTTQEKFDALKTQGVFNGYPDGSAGLEKEMTRAEFAKVLVKLFGLKEIHGTYSYKDKNYGAKNWAAPFIEAVTAEGLMQGKDLVKKIFDFNGKITIEEASKTLVTALKLEPVKDAQNNASAWAKGYFQAAVDAGLFSKDTNPKANATRSQLVEAAYAADELVKGPKVASYKVIDSKNVEFTMTDKEVVKVTLEKALEANKETEVKFQYKGKEVTAKVTYAITGAQKIETVKADNLKEVVITFDGTVDTKSAEKKDNYEVENQKIDSVTVAADQKSVKVLLEEDSTMRQQKEIEFKIKNVYNEDKSKKFDQTIKFTPVDVTLPEVKEVIGLGTKAFKVVFSEPVKKTGVFASSNFKVDGKSVSATVDYHYPNVAVVKTDLPVGEHKVTVSNIEDYYNLKIAPVEKTFTIAEDTTAPEVESIKTTDLKELEITFNETVKSVEKVYHTNSDNEGSVTIKDNKVTVKFDSKKMLNAGENVIHIEGVTDYSGNKADRTAKVTPTLDTERPEVTKVEYSHGDKQITLTFNKPLDRESVQNRANYTIKNKDNDLFKHDSLDKDGHPVIKVDFENDNGKIKEDKVVIKLSETLPSATYNIEVKNVRDDAAIKNTMLPYKSTFKAENKDSGSARAWVQSDSYDDFIYVQFPKNVKTDGVGSAIDEDKYTIAGKRVHKDTDAEMVSGDTVRLKAPRGTYLENDGKTFKAGWVENKATSIEVRLVQNTDGDYFETNGQYKIVIDDITDAAVKATKASAEKRDELEVKFNGKLSNVDERDFIVNVNGKDIKPNRAKLNDDKDVVTLYFTNTNNKLPADLNGATLKTITTPSTQDQFGNKIKVDQGVTDKIRPELEAISFDTKATDVTGLVYNVTLDLSKNVKFSTDTATTMDAAYNTLFSASVDKAEGTISEVKYFEENGAVVKSKLILKVTFKSPLKPSNTSILKFGFSESGNDRVKAITGFNNGEGLKEIATSDEFGHIK